ncbi:probable G-protein coupled receptor 148 [Varanus komodoensis]|uniref:G-protein coupled receptors family 1 profile domain-containing protein n=1 Tax=Varanus komodoensis TaxID=61221 RepID=A0A8D2J0B1_VARKO|nr:probable G-protein coupled receptor 148 [Varanus komodoensis]
MNFSLCVPARILNETIYYRELVINTTFSLEKPPLQSLQEWIIYPPSSKTKMFLIPPIVCLTAAILVIPFILFVIFSRDNIRQETRYLLLANALLCDLIYLILYAVSAVFSVSSFSLSKSACVILLFLLAMTYCGGLLTAVAMVLDIYLAILWPLHYISILPSSRAKKLILLLWVSSGICPGIIFLILKVTQKPSTCPVENCSVPIILVMTLQGDEAVKFCYVLSISALLLCLSLILCCYVILYFKTKQSGIWKSIFSRASVTFLMHHIILFFHFTPLLAAVVEALLYVNAIIGPQTGVWVSLIICNVLIILPKALSPYLCGLRYREISSSLKFFLRWKNTTVVSPALST